MTDNIFPLNICDENKTEGNISVSGTKQSMRTWYKTLVEKTYPEAVDIINKHHGTEYRILKIDEVDMPLYDKTIKKDRINLILKTPMNFNNNIILKNRKIINWLAVEKNQQNTIVINIQIF